MLPARASETKLVNAEGAKRATMSVGHKEWNERLLCARWWETKVSERHT